MENEQDSMIIYSDKFAKISKNESRMNTRNKLNFFSQQKYNRDLYAFEYNENAQTQNTHH